MAETSQSQHCFKPPGRVAAGAAGCPVHPKDSSTDEVAAAINHVASKAAEWAALPPADKRDLLEACLENLKNHSEAFVQAACAERGYDFDNAEHGHLVAETYVLSVTVCAAWLRGGITLLDSLASKGEPPKGSNVTARPDGTSRVTVFPNGFKDSLLGDTGKWMGVPLGEGGSFEVVLRGEPEQFAPLEAAPSVTGVLGAGNTEICNDIIDPLCKLNSVVIYKSNPVMAMGAVIKEAVFKPLIDKGYLRIVHGGADQGRQIVESPQVDRFIMTGSSKTFDRIVWGKKDKTDASVTPEVSKPVISELGSVNPYIVVPGDTEWSQADIEAQADALAAYKLYNAGHICAAPQVLITCRQWPQREAFLAALRTKLAAAPVTHNFYPGARSTYDEHLAAMGEDAKCRSDTSDFAGAALVPLLKVDALEDPGLKGLAEEAFSPVLYEVAVDTPANLEDFLPQAVDFCHERCWGSLTCTVVVDDATKTRGREAFENILDSMRFGSIGVNIPPSSANAFPMLAWGGFPRHTVRDVQSGIGHIGNFGCYKNVEKVILHARFTNLHQLRLVLGNRSTAKMRARRLADTFLYMSYWRIIKFASADFIGL